MQAPFSAPMASATANTAGMTSHAEQVGRDVQGGHDDRQERHQAGEGEVDLGDQQDHRDAASGDQQDRRAVQNVDEVQPGGESPRDEREEYHQHDKRRRGGRAGECFFAAQPSRSTRSLGISSAQFPPHCQFNTAPPVVWLRLPCRHRTLSSFSPLENTRMRSHISMIVSASIEMTMMQTFLLLSIH